MRTTTSPSPHDDDLSTSSQPKYATAEGGQSITSSDKLASRARKAQVLISQHLWETGQVSSLAQWLADVHEPAALAAGGGANGTITTASFRPVPGKQAWRVTALNADGLPTEYQISRAYPHRTLDDYRCDSRPAGSDGEFAKAEAGRDIGSKRLFKRGSVTKFAESLIFQEFAALNASNNESQPFWDSDALDCQLRRIECGVWRGARAEECLDNFSCVAEFQAWVDSFDGGYGAHGRLECVQLGEWMPAPRMDGSYASKPDIILPVDRHQHGADESDRVTKMILHPFNTEQAPRDWWIGFPEGEGMPTNIAELPRFISGSYEGSTLEANCQSFVFESDALASRCAMSSAAVDDSGRRAPWWGLTLRGVDAVLVFPSTGTNIVLTTKDDGAFIQAEAFETEARAASNRDAIAFDNEWRGFLDQRRTLTNTELAAGIARAEALIGP